MMTPVPTPFELLNDPFLQFEQWYDQALASSLEMANAMTLASCDEQGRPNARMVLLKGFDHSGFRFFTNFGSQKGQELAKNPHVSAVFWWEPLLRQVRIRGKVSKLSDAAADAYYQSRSRNSRIGAWASKQSAILSHRQILEDAVQHYENKFGDGPIPLPPHWGGFLIEPREIEFWQEQPFRLHDRMRYQRRDGAWVRERLSP